MVKSENFEELDRLIRTVTPENIAVSNLRYAISKLEHLLRQADDPVIKREIEKRLAIKRRSLETAEMHAKEKLAAMIDAWLKAAFLKLLEGYATTSRLGVKQFGTEKK